MPLIRNNGQYGQLGNWGRKRKRIPKKRLLLLVSLLVLATIFAVSKNGNFGPIGFAQGDYNTSFSHTRTVIFNDTSFPGPRSSGTPTFGINLAGSTTGVSFLNITLGDFIGAKVNTVILSNWSGWCSITDDAGNTWTILNSGGPNFPTDIGGYTLVTHPFTNDRVLFHPCGGGSATGSSMAQIYHSVVGIGTTAFGTSTSLSITTTGTNSLVWEFFQSAHPSSFTSGQTQRGTADGGAGNCQSIDGDTLFANAGSQSLTASGAVCSAQTPHGAVELLAGSSQTQILPTTRWNFNTTCVKNFGIGLNFTYSTGMTGKGGANCSSADVAITLASVNLQTVSAKMLEIVAGLTANNQNAGAALLRIDIVLRTNSTLPVFGQNYYPFNDTQARAIWTDCFTNGVFASTTSDVVCKQIGAGQAFFIAHDQSKAIFTEGLTNDLVVGGSGLGTFFNAENQIVLNFTGPNNFLNSESSGGSSVSSTSANSASQLQFGQDYYILVKATFDTVNVAPLANSAGDFYSAKYGQLPVSFGMFSVPASCADPINKVACGLASPQPTFDFNPLDPSSWGNAIIKGLLWVFTVAIPASFGIAAAVIVTEIRIVGNFVGNQFGWGNVGDNIITFFNGVGGLFVSIGSVFATIGSLVTNSINSVTLTLLFTNPYFTGLANFLRDAQSAVGSGIIVNLVVQIGFWFPTSYMVILITFYFLLVLMSGLKGFFEWLHIVKWSAFSFFNVFATAVYEFTKLITAILGRLSVISPGHEFPKIPHLNAGPLPKISLRADDIAFFDDPTAWFLAFTGFVFTMMWAGTSAAGLPANTQTIIQSMNSLFLTLFGVGFMILLLYIPGFLLGKLYEKGILHQ